MMIARRPWDWGPVSLSFRCFVPFWRNTVSVFIFPFTNDKQGKNGSRLEVHLFVFLYFKCMTVCVGLPPLSFEAGMSPVGR